MELLVREALELDGLEGIVTHSVGVDEVLKLDFADSAVHGRVDGEDQLHCVLISHSYV